MRKLLCAIVILHPVLSTGSLGQTSDVRKQLLSAWSAQPDRVVTSRIKIVEYQCLKPVKLSQKETHELLSKLAKGLDASLLRSIAKTITESEQPNSASWGARYEITTSGHSIHNKKFFHLPQSGDVIRDKAFDGTHLIEYFDHNASINTLQSERAAELITISTLCFIPKVNAALGTKPITLVDVPAHKHQDRVALTRFGDDIHADPKSGFVYYYAFKNPKIIREVYQFQPTEYAKGIWAPGISVTVSYDENDLLKRFRLFQVKECVLNEKVPDIDLRVTVPAKLH
jgi:hypothetical protein